MENVVKVTETDVENFMMAHRGEYGFKPDPKNPKLRVIEKKKLVEAIRNEKLQLAANQLGQYLFNTYKVTINTSLLRKLKN